MMSYQSHTLQFGVMETDHVDAGKEMLCLEVRVGSNSPVGTERVILRPTRLLDNTTSPSFDGYDRANKKRVCQSVINRLI